MNFLSEEYFQLLWHNHVYFPAAGLKIYTVIVVVCLFLSTPLIVSVLKVLTETGILQVFKS